MRRLIAVLLVFALVFTACGSGDDDASGDSGSSESTSTDSGDDGADDGGDSGDDGTEPTESPDDGDDGDDDGDDDDGDPISVSGLDDVPQVCRDLMEQFLKDIEPIVSPIDWENATINDFEAIAPEFDQLATEFDSATEAQAGGQCDNLEIDDEDNFDLIIEFARQVAPGTVGFMTFISSFANAAGEILAEDDAGEDMGDGSAAFDDCAGAVAWMEGLIAEYDSIADVPVTEALQFADLGSFITTCTPAQLDYFDSDEVLEFLEGF